MSCFGKRNMYMYKNCFCSAGPGVSRAQGVFEEKHVYKYKLFPSPRRLRRVLSAKCVRRNIYKYIS